MIDYAYSLNSPVAIRYPKGSCGEREFTPIKDKLWDTIKEGEDITLLAVGPRMVDLAVKFAEKHNGVGVVNARSVKPICTETLEKIKNTTVVTLEENSVIGGFGSLITAYYAKKGYAVKTISLGVKDEFIGHGSVKNQLKDNGLAIEDLENILQKN